MARSSDHLEELSPSPFLDSFRLATIPELTNLGSWKVNERLFYRHPATDVPEINGRAF
jgi:hypothetical protein